MDDDNPFADPRSIGPRGGGYGTNGSIAANPNAGNANLLDFNPFGDAGTQPVLSQAPAAQPDPLEGYNPFEKGASTSSATAPAAPAVLQADADPPPPYNSLPAQQVNTDHYLQQQRELDRKARELEDRERELKARDEQLRQQQQQQQAGGDPSAVQKNWPPLPSWIPIKPCFYLDVEVDIPHAFQHIVKQMYYIWICHFVIYLLNFVGGLAFLFAEVYPTHFLLSAVWLVLYTPCSFVCWFRPIYKAFKTDSSLNFMIFFVIFCAQCAWVIIQAVGIGGSGMCGIFNGISYMKSDLAVGIICIVIGVLSGLLAAVDIVMLMRIHRLYRSKDGVSMAQARKDAVTTIMSNKGVRDTVVDVGAAAATAAATRN